MRVREPCVTGEHRGDCPECRGRPPSGRFILVILGILIALLFGSK